MVWSVYAQVCLATLFAGLAAWLSVRAPRHLSTKAESGPDAPAAPDDGLLRSLSSLVRARADAAPWRRRFAMTTVGALAVGFGLSTVGGGFAPAAWAMILPLAVLVAVILGRLEPTRTRRRRDQLVLELPHALELLSACLAAGLPLRRATAAVADSFAGPVAEDLAQVMSVVELGMSDAQAWLTLKTHPQWGAAATDLARSVESGTMMVEVLMHHARDARNIRRASMEVLAKAVGVRSVLPLMTCFIPAFLLIGIVPTVASAVRNALF